MGEIDFNAWRERIRRDTFGSYHFHMGVAIEREGNDDAAFDAYQRAMAADPDNLSAYYRAYMLLSRLGRAEEATALDQRARARNPNYQTEYQDAVVRDLIQDEKFEEARAQADTFLVKDQSEGRRRLLAEVEAVWGDHLRHRQRWEDAAPHLERALSLDPDQPLANYWIGFHRLNALDLTGAEPHLERAVAGMPEHPWAACMLGYVRLVEARLDEAEALIGKAAPFLEDSQKPWAHGHLGLIAHLGGDARKAMAGQHQAAALDPKESWVFCYLGWTMLGQGRHAEAEQLFRRSAALTPNVSMYWAFVGLAMFEQGRRDDGMRLIRDAASQETAFALTLIVRALVEERLGDRTTALDLYRKAADWQPQFIGYVTRLLFWESERLKNAWRDIGLCCP